MVESAFSSFKKLLDQCKNQELEAPGGMPPPRPPLYGQLLAFYLLHNDINNISLEEDTTLYYYIFCP
uniref:Uncharacterized protein n=1 Tax=Canis lupus familiaris TaxID=9615 RepID=A0A8P0PIJ0_CANLF